MTYIGDQPADRKEARSNMLDEDILRRVSTMEADINRMKDENSRVRVDGFSKLASLEVKIDRLLSNDIPHIQQSLDLMATKVDAMNMKSDARLLLLEADIIKIKAHT